MKIISIIIPVYNAEKCLPKCIKSIIEQTYKNLEIVLVNDGSLDNSGELCEEYAQKDNRIKVIHKENGGVSSARNIGIENAIGDYIVFVDSDDYIEKYMIEEMIASADETVELIHSSFKYIGDNEKKEYFPNGVYSPKEWLEMYSKGQISGSGTFAPWAKLFRTDIIKNNNIRFDESMSLGEDVYFNLQYLRKCSKITSLNKVHYCYVVGNENSLTYKFQKDTYSQINKYVNETVSVMKELKCSDCAIKNYEILKSRYLVSQVFLATQNAGSKELKKYIKEISNDEMLKKHFDAFSSIKTRSLLWLIFNKRYFIAYLICRSWFFFRKVKKSWKK